MGKSSSGGGGGFNAAYDAALKQQGPGLSSQSPILQLTMPGSMPGFGGQVPMGQNFAQQLGNLPPGLLQQIRALQAGPQNTTTPTLPPLPQPPPTGLEGGSILQAARPQTVPTFPASKVNTYGTRRY